MSSLAPRLPFLRLPPSSFLAPAAGPSTFRTFTSAGPRLRAIAVDDLPDHGSKVTLPLRAPEAPTEGSFISRHFRPRTSLPSRLPRSRFLLKVSAPVPTTSPHPSPPQALVHDATRDLYFTYRPQMDVAEEREAFKRLMGEVRKEGGFARVFWGQAGTEGKSVEVLLGEKVEPEAFKEF